MEYLFKHVEVIGSICGSALATWALFVKIDKSYKSHLKEEFASKRDFQRLENKMDELLLSLVSRRINTASRKRRSKTIA